LVQANQDEVAEKKSSGDEIVAAEEVAINVGENKNEVKEEVVEAAPAKLDSGSGVF